MSKFDVSKFKLKFDKPRKQQQQQQQQQQQPTVDTKQAAKKRWWQKINMGLNIGSNKQGVSKDEY